MGICPIFREAGIIHQNLKKYAIFPFADDVDINCPACDRYKVKNSLNLNNSFYLTNQYVYIGFHPKKSIKHALEFNFKWINNQKVYYWLTDPNPYGYLTFKKLNVKYVPYLKIKSVVGKKNNRYLYLMPTLSYAYIYENIVSSYDYTEYNSNGVSFRHQVRNATKFSTSRAILNLQLAHSIGLFKNKQAIEWGFWIPLLAKFWFNGGALDNHYNEYEDNKLTISVHSQIRYPAKSYFYYLFQKPEQTDDKPLSIRPPINIYLIYNLYNSKNSRK